MTVTAKRFILIDDDSLNNRLSEFVLKKSLGEISLAVFTDAVDALEYIKTNFDQTTSPDSKTTIILDINMPTISGWEFLDAFRKFPESLQQQFNIYLLSSSVSNDDIQRCKTDPLIIDFIEKPLNKTALSKLLL
jgi:CheY-like chemotaxis protein